MKAYWWKSKYYPNLGNSIGHKVLEKAYGIDVAFASMRNADLIAGGSVLGWLYDNKGNIDREKKLAVVGVGFQHQNSAVKDLDLVEFFSVRGLLTKNKLGLDHDDSVSVGDPGMLAVDLTDGLAKETEYELGLVLHHGFIGGGRHVRKFEKFSPLLIDVRTDDFSEVVRQISSCRFIVSQSLIGLIIADALGIPNAWVDLGRMHVGENFKFYDYFSTVDRAPSLRINGALSSYSQIRSMLNYPNGARITKVKASVRAAYDRMLESI